MKDYYEILNVSRNAEPEIISIVYRRLAKKYHPDRNPGRREWAESKFKEISEAYQVLSDPDRRMQYDKQLAELDKQLQQEQSKYRKSKYEETQYVTSRSGSKKLYLKIMLFAAVLTVTGVFGFSAFNITPAETTPDSDSTIEPEEAVPELQASNDMRPPPAPFQNTLEVGEGIALMSDSFGDGLDGWSYWGDSGYALSHNAEAGHTAPDVKIVGDAFDSVHGMQKIIDITPWSAGSLILSFDYRVTSDYLSANTHLRISDADTNQILYQESISAGTRDSGWARFSKDISSMVMGSDKIKIVLFLKDSAKVNWNQVNSYDNMRLENFPSDSVVTHFSVNTDKSSYLPDNTVLVHGKVHKIVDGVPVIIEIFNPDGEINQVVNATIQQDGTYATTFALDYLEGDIMEGTWTLKAFYLDKEAERTILFTRPELSEDPPTIP